jgi:endothelin-converting enzyme/putative endopeptidase
MRDTAYVHQQDREFFVAYARTLRRKITDAAMRAQVSSNDHAPEEYRVDTVRNLDAWYEAFDVRPGQRLYLARTARVRVW